METARFRALQRACKKRSRKGILDGLRSSIEIDNHRAVDVGHLRQGIWPFYVQKPFSEVSPEAIREGEDDLTLRAEEVKTLKACINLDHIEENRWDRRWLMRTGTLSAKQFTKELKGVNGMHEKGSRSQKAE